MLRRALIALVCAMACLLAIGLWQRDAITRLMAVQTLFAPDQIVANFSNMDALFEHVDLSVSGTPTPLPATATGPLPEDLDVWTDRRSVTGMVVLRDGARVFETYRLGTNANDPRISWSLAKSYLSALFGILRAEGYFPDLDAPVTGFAPELTGSAYDGASLRHVLQMSTGVAFDEDYLDFWSDINKMGRVLALGGSMDRFALGLTERQAPPGTRWQYVSIDTHVMGMVIRGATGQSLPDLMTDKLLQPMGTYGAPFFLTDGHGAAFALGGLNLTTRDYARLGEMFRNDGRFQGKQIVPADWVRESTRASADTPAGAKGYGYQWWTPADARAGEFMAQGVYGQYIYVDRQSATVVAINAADTNFRARGAADDALDMMRRIAWKDSQ
ncbi:serine hydrolase domain-containing protein [Sagittula sp. SSi028]|uniref:serine hydrolase domain-containing protein n=1 Tax=Sagittula sp. SSi028 TaxID=3400636 RepID=UPI003AF550AA